MGRLVNKNILITGGNSGIGLGRSAGIDVMRLTMGKGPSGLEREAYYAGWLVVGYWLKHGMAFADIARIPEKEMPQHVNEVIEKLLAQ